MSLRTFFNLLHQQNTSYPVNPPPPPVGNGFTYDEHDLSEWKYRMDNQIYWNWNDVPSEANTIITRKNAFVNNKPALYQGPISNYETQDGQWNGTGQIPPWSDDPHNDYKRHLHGDDKSMSYILNAAFYARVYDDEALGKLVIERLVQQFQVSKLDYKTLPRFKASDNGSFQLNPFFLMAEWLVSRAYAYDYCKKYATSIQKTIIENRLRDGAYWHKSLTDIVLLEKYFAEKFWDEGKNKWEYVHKNADGTYNKTIAETDRNNLNWHREQTEALKAWKQSFTHDSGYQNPQHGLDYTNRSLANSGLSACVIGHIINDEGLKQHSWNMFREFFVFNIYSDGTSADCERGLTEGPTYYSAILNNLSTMAYIAWKVDGNKEYFDFETISGTNNHTVDGRYHKGTAGGPKGLKMFIKACSNYYRSKDDGGWNPERKIGGQSINGHHYSGYFSGRWTYHHIYGAAKANKYYKDAEIEDYFMMRESAGYRGFEPKSKTAPSGHEYITKGVYNNCVDTALKYFPRP